MDASRRKEGEMSEIGHAERNRWVGKGLAGDKTGDCGEETDTWR